MNTPLDKAQTNAIFLYDKYIHPCFVMARIVGKLPILNLDYAIADHIRQQGHDWMLFDTKEGIDIIIALLQMVDDDPFLTELVNNIVDICIQTQAEIDADENNTPNNK